SVASIAVRLRPGMPFAFPSESAFTFAGIPIPTTVIAGALHILSTFSWRRNMAENNRLTRGVLDASTYG
ncbi:MAG TPA: hypothetical protein VN708_22985, partial [Terriglobales bacterium]|nr:hypothetical protein [Terriglobales bacterium]